MQENTNPLCKYKNAFGKLGEGIHSYRIFDIAVLDVIVTILFGLLLSWITKISVYYMIPGVFVLGIVVHRLFCVRTAVDKMLFPGG